MFNRQQAICNVNNVDNDNARMNINDVDHNKNIDIFALVGGD